MRPLVIATFLGALLVCSGASAQAGTLVVPPGYGSSGTGTATTTSGTVTGTVTLAVPDQGMVVTAPPRMPTGHWETRTRETSIRGLWLTGLIALPVSWLLTWSVSATALPTSSGGVAFAYIPVIGPWLMLTEALNGYEPFAVTMGVIQGAAALCLILGLTLRETVEEQVWVISDLGGGRTLAVDGTFGPGGGMASATLHF